MKVSLHSIFSKLQTKILTEHNCYAADNIPFSDTHKIGISLQGSGDLQSNAVTE